VKTAADLPSKVMPAGHDNPQTGPFFIEGAEPGDTVAVHIRKLEPARPYAVSSFGPGFGALVGTDLTAMLGPDFPETTWRYDVDSARNVARTTSHDGKHSWEVPLAPFLGCLGVAPAGGEVRTTIVPGIFGGNMDCPEVRAGNTVFLGVNVAGALVSFGDGHYAMGDGEIMGAAIEGAMNVEVYIELIKKKFAPVPRIENADEVMFVGAGRPLEDAARIAFKAMIGWVRERSGMSEMDAYQFVSQNAKAPIIQLVDPEYTVIVKIEKKRVSGTGR
jgi:acetamidase/formamidase